MSVLPWPVWDGSRWDSGEVWLTGVLVPDGGGCGVGRPSRRGSLGLGASSLRPRPRVALGVFVCVTPRLFGSDLFERPSKNAQTWTVELATGPGPVS